MNALWKVANMLAAKYVQHVWTSWKEAKYGKLMKKHQEVYCELLWWSAENFPGTIWNPLDDSYWKPDHQDSHASVANPGAGSTKAWIQQRTWRDVHLINTNMSMYKKSPRTTSASNPSIFSKPKYWVRKISKNLAPRSLSNNMTCISSSKPSGSCSFIITLGTQIQADWQICGFYPPVPIEYFDDHWNLQLYFGILRVCEARHLWFRWWLIIVKSCEISKNIPPKIQPTIHWKSAKLHWKSANPSTSIHSPSQGWPRRRVVWVIHICAVEFPQGAPRGKGRFGPVGQAFSSWRWSQPTMTLWLC